MNNERRITSLSELQALRDERSRHAARREYRFRVCMGASCIASGADEVLERLRDELAGRNGTVELVGTGCMGPCSAGPLITVAPSGKRYAGVKPEDVPRIVADAMSATAESQPDGLAAFYDAQTRVVLGRCGSIDPGDIEDAIAHDAYAALGKALELEPDAIINTVKESGLRGRGGAGFPTWLKWQFTREAVSEDGTKYVICNADEGDPGAFMDRSILEGDPHSLIEGMAIAARAVGAKKGFVYVRAEYPLAIERLETAIGQAREYGMLGPGILGSDFSFELEIRKGSGAFVCGEETALMNSIEGKRGEPRPRPPFPAQKGLWGRPSVLNNVETYANVAAIITRCAQWHSIGTEHSKGTKVFALAGAVVNTGLVEVPIGTTLGELLYDIGGGVRAGRAFKAAQIGGPSGGCIPREHLNVQLDYESLQELGAIMGSGGLIVMDDETCMVDVARYFLEFVQEESCGKCVPCRVGTRRMLEILNRIAAGEGHPDDIDRLIELGERIKDTSLCGLGQTAPNPVLSTIRHFRHEYEAHIREKHCEAGICAGLVRAPCQSACPAGVDVPGFVSLIAERRYAEALQLHRDRNPFAAVCARVCFHTCEDHCRRASLDSPVAIRAVKRFMVDQEVVIQLPEVRENPDNEKRKIAIIGAGPAGLSCAYFLARLGYRPTVFEAESRPGGMLVQTIPAYRLPRETLAREIRMIEQLGVEIRTGVALGRDFTLGSLQDEGYETVYLGVGAPGSQSMGVPGEDAAGVLLAGDYLRQYNIRGSVPVGKNTVIVGGGNAAVDAARTALRLGAETVTVIYRRTREQMPAYAEEIEEALHEGVELRDLTQPIRINVDEDGKVTSIRCARMTLGEFDRSGRRRPKRSEQDEFDLPADLIIAAIGQTLDLAPLLRPDMTAGKELELNADGFVAINPLTGQTSIPWIFGGGDASSGPASVVDAIAAGERAAVGIDLYLTGESHAFWREGRTVDTAFDPDADPAPYPREAYQTIDVARRRHNFDEVEHAWCEAVTLRQAKRCLRCDYGKPAAAQVQPTREELRA